MNKTQMIKRELAKGANASNEEIAAKVGCTKAMVSYVRCNKVVKKRERIVGVIADLHIPAVLPGYLEYCVETFKTEGVTDIMFIGDVFDFHALSRHVSEPMADSPYQEFVKSKEIVAHWAKAFPVAKICEGNHCAIPKRQAKEVGMPDLYLRSLNDVYDLPSTWEWDYGFTIDGVRYEHGLGSAGQYGCRNTAMKMGMSYVQGHTHGNAAVMWISSECRTIFGMNVGAAVDQSHIAMKYSQNYKMKQTPGVGIVRNGKSAYFLPMI